MKKLALLFIACTSYLYAVQNKPKLVLTIVVDQFRYDYLTRFRSDYTGGIARLLTQGAVCTNANYEHFPTVTAIGHATILTGAYPSISGIVGNEWPDRATGKEHTSVSDDATVLVGGKPGLRGSSPRRLLVSTIGDELKMSNGGASHVIGVSLKDRSAILPAGHMADAAFWFDLNSGYMTSSDYYFKDKQPPAYLTTFNARDYAAKHLGKDWMPADAKPGDKPYWSVPGERTYANFESFERTAWGSQMLEEFVEQVIASEKLGQHSATDLLTVSYSSNDLLGHKVGPDSPAVRAISIETDRLIGRLFQFIEGRIGRGNMVVVFTADHGVPPTPEMSESRKMPGGRIFAPDLDKAIMTALNAHFGPDEWMLNKSGLRIYLNRNLAAKHRTTVEEIQRVAAEAVRATPNIFRVYTASDLAAGRILGDYIDQRVRNSYNVVQGADLFVIPDPYYIFYTASTRTGTDHGLPFKYDTHVPVIFMGAGIKPGQYNMPVAVNDIAPTLATMLSIETPSGSVGRVLTEILQ